MPVGFFELGVLVLATWRLSHLIAVEDGPGDLFARLKRGAGAMKPVGGTWHATNFWGKLLTCMLCQSVWWAAVLLVVYLYMPALWPVVIVLAVSGGASLLHLVTA